MATESSTIVQRLRKCCNVLREASLEESPQPARPEVLAREIVEELEASLAQFEGILESLNGEE